MDAAQRCRDLGNEAGLPLHLGIHAGDVVREGNNVHGGAVQVAARVQSVAAPGEILVSATVRDLARTSAGVEFEDRGEHELKGIAEPQRLFAVRAERSP
ncbi:MAG: adenylate/guanylate cyclase domain-containing protein [Chloroflexi bacterium]|nr:adenylate/guanylate cyclase domain-containing protein [Chloroflexota bacterium]